MILVFEDSGYNDSLLLKVSSTLCPTEKMRPNAKGFCLLVSFVERMTQVYFKNGEGQNSTQKSRTKYTARIILNLPHICAPYMFQ